MIEIKTENIQIFHNEQNRKVAIEKIEKYEIIEFTGQFEIPL